MFQQPKLALGKGLQQVLHATLATVLGLLLWSHPAFAASNQSNQDLNQPATLTAPEPSFQINVYPQPNVSSRRIGYGLGGDPVTVLQQVGSNEGYTWDYLRFENAANIGGWVQAQYVSVAGQVANLQNQSRQEPGGYLGARQTGHFNQQQGYQQNQNQQH